MIKVTRIQAVALAALLASCGGGQSLETAVAPERAAPASFSAATPVDAANQLMDWVEAQVPFQGFFPEHQATQLDIPPFVYRRYSSGVYFIVVANDNPAFPVGGVYVLGGAFGGVLHLGQLSDFAGLATPPGPSAAASCPAFASGTYRFIKPAPAGQATDVTLAAVAMDSSGTPKISKPGTAARTMTPGAAPCSFTLPDGSGVAVSPAGVALVSALENGGSRYPALMFPEQTTALSDLTGAWNRLSWNRRDPGGLDQPYKLSYGAFTLIASGAITAGTECSTAGDLSGGCQSGTLNGGLAVNSTGGFSGTGDLSGGRVFAYKKGTDTMMIAIDPDGSLTMLTPQASSGLPTVGSSNTAWVTNANTAGILGVAGTNAIPGFSSNVNTVTSVDSVTSVVVRSSVQDGAAPVTQTLRYNVPLPGFRKRDGVPNLVSAAIFLPVRGMGLTAVSRLGATDATTPGTGNGFLSLSIDQP